MKTVRIEKNVFYTYFAWLLPEKYMLPCLSKQVFGIDCPGCGLQRSVILLLNGKFAESFFMYPGLFPMLALFGFLAAGRFIAFKRANTITILLAVITVMTILTNFIIKLVN